MAGYSGFSKSNNAVDAESEGKMVLTNFVKYLKKFFPGVTSADVRMAVSPSEWHHSSKFYNEVNYYDPMSLADSDTRNEIREAIVLRKEIGTKKIELNAIFGGVASHWYTLDPKDCDSIRRLRLEAARVRAQRSLGFVPEVTR